VATWVVEAAVVLAMAPVSSDVNCDNKLFFRLKSSNSGNDLHKNSGGFGTNTASSEGS